MHDIIGYTMGRRSSLLKDNESTAGADASVGTEAIPHEANLY